MNDAHIHLLINHIPIIGLIIGVLILLFGIIFKSSLTKKIALAVVLCCVFLAIPSFSTGEEAEEVIEHMSSMTKETHHLIHEHEEKAELFMPFAWILIVLSLVTLFFEWKKKKFASYLSILTLVVGLIAIYIVREVGTTGGEITHPEIRKGFVPTEEEHED